MTYKECIMRGYESLSQDPKSIFVGYNVKVGRGGGMYKNIPEDKLFETPVAENLMTGIAIGLSIDGYNPILYFERFNFILNALDAIVNHLDKFESLSYGQYKPKVIMRAVIGGITTPFYTGSTHTQDFTKAIKEMVSFQVFKLSIYEKDINAVFDYASFSPKSILIIEEKDLYEKQLL
jgi:pyruvate/2-oxoglutarate/acetoin dehydrogenase E1 component